eukprot:CAMPEP_0176372600 /NCGR_PEP_ID=MMETSP0126-20121128/25492_1 /TAXON_ID=141414 ORGANISM="Strombidinopsis acuminatum, Strain SPMC142" /NCGR_SAMPLE_ID=MMETSP0126 /ASSEMBLY_ACC=CAM_ASM_000229 /LENGTH=100 /DNA_ID=CAMNT_0017732483 /DNA_START=81 /DNA_END=383 /DNA_ORIENTATION=+
MKAVLNNNIATCFLKFDALDKADEYNTYALVEDADLPRAFTNKMKIMEARGDIPGALSVARFAKNRFDSQWETEETRKIAKEFSDAIPRLEKIEPEAKAD